MTDSAEEQLAKALEGQFFHYIGKDKQVRERDQMMLDPEYVPTRKAPRKKKPSEPPKPLCDQSATDFNRLREIHQKVYPAGKYSFQRILDICCAVYCVWPENVIGPSRSTHLVQARRQVVRVLREKRGMSFVEIGKRLNRDHSTILHAFNSALDNPKPLQKAYDEINRQLENYGGGHKLAR